MDLHNHPQTTTATTLWTTTSTLRTTITTTLRTSVTRSLRTTITATPHHEFLVGVAPQCESRAEGPLLTPP